jgi:hypothetical protein
VVCRRVFYLERGNRLRICSEGCRAETELRQRNHNKNHNKRRYYADPDFRNRQIESAKASYYTKDRCDRMWMEMQQVAAKLGEMK